ncbi:hypothetical protein BpHYR1_038499 [Brachionus plicatilis]|uniref:Uncharacterized protein n=1 Tax=Brachionus plicatilis TaxID=10195 RepID=A0A3M7PQF3_BRAPC|nr:hypothetical protein BpHYR1_038499 [Brachionus plicatilis]
MFFKLKNAIRTEHDIIRLVVVNHSIRVERVAGGVSWTVQFFPYPQFRLPFFELLIVSAPTVSRIKILSKNILKIFKVFQ